MNRDRFDDLLRDKLGDSRVEPPTDMWSRIAATMNERAASQNGQATQTGHAPEQAAPPFAILRPRRLRLGYAAVAAILVCALVFGLRFLDIEPAQTPQSDLAQELPFDIVTPEQLDNLIADAAVPVRPAMITAPQPRITTQKTAIETPPIEWNDEPMPTISAPAIPAKNNDEPVENAAVEWIDRAEIEKLLGGSDEKRARQFSVGLYSSNLGNTSSEKVVNSSRRASLSELAVHETTNGAYSSAASGSTTTRLQHKMPLSGGLSVTMELADRLWVESGATYTYMLSKGRTPSEDIHGAYSVRQELHYVGIPVGVKYDFVRGGRVEVYGGAAALFEMCVSSRFTKKMEEGGVSGDSYSMSLNVRGIQPSIGVHAGAEVKLSGNLGLYLEPGANYYFETDRQPESYRTEHPLNFSLRAGFRMRLK